MEVSRRPSFMFRQFYLYWSCLLERAYITNESKKQSNYFEKLLPWDSWGCHYLNIVNFFHGVMDDHKAHSCASQKLPLPIWHITKKMSAKLLVICQCTTCRSLNCWRWWVRSYQEEFLWEGQSDRKKLQLMKWSEVIKPKSCGGLGLGN